MHVTFTGMKRVLPIALCCLTTIVCAQQTISVPIIVASGDQTSISIKNTDLKAEIDHQAVTIASITPLAPGHLKYVLLSDQSGATRWPRGIRQQTDIADRLLRQVITAGDDLGSLVNFGDDIYIDVQNEKDPKKLMAKLERDGRGATKLYDAVVASAKWLGKQPVDPEHRKVMFLFCDGEDNGSKNRLTDAVDALQAATIPVFVIAPATVERKNRGNELRQLADSSGGRAYFLVPDLKAVDFASLKRDLSQSFLLKVTTPPITGLLPLIITDRSNLQLSIIAPSRIAVPQ